MMQKFRQNRPRLKLNDEEYTLLRNRVLDRDAWRCQNCGSSNDLHSHHQTKRSKLGNDTLENLITLLCELSSKTASFSKRSSGRFVLIMIVPVLTGPIPVIARVMSRSYKDANSRKIGVSPVPVKFERSAVTAFNGNRCNLPTAD
jgi:hypothetical protein